MTIYLDSSVLLKVYLDEPDSDAAQEVLASDESWASAGITLVEVRRTLSREYDGIELNNARGQFERDWEHIEVVAVDGNVCERAAELAELTGTRTLDALHLGAAHRAGAPKIAFATFDLRQAQAARSLGWTVLGA